MNPVSNEICRMSWFLVEMDEALSKGLSHPNGNPVYCIIHSVDLIDSDPSNMYINRVVKFNHNHAIMHGKILLASDDRLFVERHLKQMTRNAEEAVVKNENDKRFLVQYNRGPNTVTHAIVHNKELCWTVANDAGNAREVIIRDGQVQRLATVLYAHEQEEKMQTQLQRLKTKCWNGAFDAKDEDTEMSGNPWLLVQYSSSPANVVYAIISFSETVWQEENLYKDVVAYIADGATVYQSIIIRKSLNRNELDYELRNIKETTAIAQFPLEAEVDSIMAYQPPSQAASKGPPVDHQTLCAKSMQLDHTEERSPLHHSKDLLRWEYLDEMEQHMQNEAALVAEAFEAIDYIRSVMEKRQAQLEQHGN